MKNLSVALKLKYLYYLKGIGYEYTKPLTDFELASGSNLPNSMEGLKNSCLNCFMCELAKTRNSVVFGEGNEKSPIMFVGEGPGEAEDKSGRPFVGAAGELLTKMIEGVLQLKRESVYITNVVKCRPPNNRVPTKEECACCKPYLDKQIELISPKIIVALGATALNTLTGENYSIMKMRGNLLELGSAKLIPTYHPSFVLRNPSTAKKPVYADLLLVKSLLDSLSPAK